MGSCCERKKLYTAPYFPCAFSTFPHDRLRTKLQLILTKLHLASEKDVVDCQYSVTGRQLSLTSHLNCRMGFLIYCSIWDPCLRRPFSAIIQPKSSSIHPQSIHLPSRELSQPITKTHSSKPSLYTEESPKPPNGL